MKKILKITFLLTLVHGTTLAQSAYSRWEQDIEFLNRELEIRHADLYHSIHKDSLNRHFKILASGLSNYLPEAIPFELEKVLVKINDGHTGMFLPFNNDLEFQFIPLNLLRLHDGLVVTNSSSRHLNLIGSKLMAIEGVSVEELFNLIKDYIPHDNAYGRLDNFKYYVVIAELLKQVGLTIDDGSVTCTFKLFNGKVLKEELSLVSKSDYQALSGTIRLRQGSGQKPMWLDIEKGKFWSNQSNDLLYIQLNSSDIGGLEQEMKTFAKEIIRQASNESISKIALDLRMNVGGSLRRTNPLLQAFIAIDQMYPEKPLFVLIGNSTFSAANSLATLINRFTSAIFVGAPSGGKPNTVGDLGWITLPNNKIRVRYSRLHVKNSDEWDARPSIFPDLKAPVTFAHFSNNQDPGLDAINKYRERKSPIPPLMAFRNDINQLLEKFHDLKDNHYNDYIFDDELLQTIAIQLFQEGLLDADSGFKILKTYVREYPWLPDAHGSLGQLYLQTGDTVQAMNHLKEAFRLHKGYTKWREVINFNLQK